MRVPAQKGMAILPKSHDCPHPAREDLRGHRNPSWQCHNWVRETQSIRDPKAAHMTHTPSPSLPGPTVCLALGRRAYPVLLPRSGRWRRYWNWPWCFLSW